MCEAEEHARTEIGSLAAGLKGTVRISLSPSLSPWMIKKVICPFHERHREITFRIRESYQLPLIEEVRRGISEIGVVNAPLPDPSLFRILKRTGASLAVIGKDDHPLLVSHERVKPEELCPFPVAVSRSTDEMWNRLCREKGLPSHPLASLDSRASAVLFAKSGMALSVVVWNEGEIAPEGLLCRPLEDHSFNPSITCFTLRGHVLSGGMERFVNFMEL